MLTLSKWFVMVFVMGCGSAQDRQNRQSAPAGGAPAAQEEQVTAEADLALRYANPTPGLCQDLARIRPTTDNDGVDYSCSIALSPCQPTKGASCSAIAVIETASGTTQSQAKYLLATKVCANKNYWPQLPKSFAAFKPQCAAFAY
jgi:hypothetical protein